MNSSLQKGFTLVELMISIAVLTVIVSIAIPAYNGYVREAQLGAARANADSLRLFLEDWRLENSTYQVGGNASFDPKATTVLGWAPDGDKGLYTYAVVGATTNTYTINVTHTSGRWIRCEDRMNNCCDGTGAITACP